MSQFITNSFSRRSFLRVGGGLLSVPFLETFARGASRVSAAPPKRLIFLGGGFGFTKQTFYPTDTGRFAKIGLTKGLMPLQSHMEDITMVSNLTNDSAQNPHGGSGSYLSCANRSLSCDQLAAMQLGKESRYRSLVLTARESDGLQNSGHGSGLSLSWNAEGKPIPGLNKPLELFQILFANKEQSSDQLREDLAKRKSVLDIVHKNAKSLNNKLSGNDQEKLQEYFQSLREIEQGLQRQAQWAKVPKPDAPFDAPGNDVVGEAEIKLMYDMIIIALQTDATRVISYRLPVCSLLSSLGLTLKAHSLSHYGFSQARREASELRDQKCMELFSHFIERLKQTEDIDGSRLYDNCIVSYGTNLRSGHELRNLPALLTGGAVGVKHGSHLALANKNTPLASYWLTLMRQAGAQVDQFNGSTESITELVG